jgi:hypothetical protein
MIVQWTTLKMPSVVQAIVFESHQSESGGTTFAGSSSPSADGSKWFHVARLSGLTPATQYDFVITGEEQNTLRCLSDTDKIPCLFPFQSMTSTYYTPIDTLKLFSSKVWCGINFIDEWDYCTCTLGPKQRHTFKTAVPKGDLSPFNVLVYGDLGLDLEGAGKCFSNTAVTLNTAGNAMPFTMMALAQLATGVGYKLDTENNVCACGAGCPMSLERPTLQECFYAVKFNPSCGDYFSYGDGVCTCAPTSETSCQTTPKSGHNTYQRTQSSTDGPAFALHMGDIAYADNYYLRIDSLGNSYEVTWDIWMNMMGTTYPVLNYLPYMTLPGNHEATCNEATPFICTSTTTNFTAYRERFTMPTESGGVSPMWYSFDYGGVHFIQIDTETDYPDSPSTSVKNSGGIPCLGGGPFGDQLGWLEEDLIKAVANRQQVPWIIVSGHRPFYSSFAAASIVCYQCRQHFQRLFEQYGVDVYFGAHLHGYERLYPVNTTGTTGPWVDAATSQAQGCPKLTESYDNPKVPVMVTHGAAGNREMMDCLTTTQLPCTVKYLSTDFGFGRLFIDSPSQLRWQYHNALGSGMELADEFTLVKDRS